MLVMYMNKNIVLKDKFDFWVIPRLVLFLILPNIFTTPLRIFVEGYIYGKTGAPAFVTPGFLIYGFCAELVFGAGYMLFGYLLPVKNTVLRAFSYMSLILVSSYLPNIFAMAGGDGELIASSFSLGIVVVDIVSYLLKGLILGLLFKNYDVEKPFSVLPVNTKKFIVLSLINGLVFAALNYLTDIAAGVLDRSWRLCSILQVSEAAESRFYIVFIIFMFVAGFLLTLWNRYCLSEIASATEALFYAIKLSAVVWLPNVLIMAFFGASFIKTFVYGAFYVLMFIACVLAYRKADSLIK